MAQTPEGANVYSPPSKLNERAFASLVACAVPLRAAEKVFLRARSVDRDLTAFSVSDFAPKLSLKAAKHRLRAQGPKPGWILWSIWLRLGRHLFVAFGQILT